MFTVCSDALNTKPESAQLHTVCQTAKCFNEHPASFDEHYIKIYVQFKIKRFTLIDS